MSVALRSVNDVLYAMRISHSFVAPCIVNNVSYMIWINYEVLCTIGIVLCRTG